MATKIEVDDLKNTGVVLRQYSDLAPVPQNLESALKEFTTAAKSKNFLKVETGVSPDFLEFESKEVLDAVPGQIVSLERIMTEKVLLVHLKKEKIHHEFSLVDAIKKATEAVEVGVMDGSYPRPIWIHLSNKKDGRVWKLVVSKMSDETLILVVVECRLDVNENPGASDNKGKRVVVKAKVTEK